MSDLGFALVGCGDIGARNAASIAEAPGARLVRAVDVDADAARRVGERFGVPTGADLDAALRDPEVAAVFVATPHDLHAAMVEACAAAGRHVVVEKPLATTLADAERAVAACRSHGVHLATCHPRRYEDKIGCARDYVGSGRLGRVLGTRSTFFKAKNTDYWDAAWRRSRARSGGGVVIMNLIHHLDALRVVTGLQIDAAAGLVSSQVDGHEVEDTAAISLRYANGALGTMTACTAVAGPKVFEDLILGELGRVVIDKRSVRFLAHADPERQWETTEFAEDTVSKRRFVAAFAASVAGGNPPPVSGEYGLQLLRTTLQAYGVE